jgi:hypothetical protein
MHVHILILLEESEWCNWVRLLLEKKYMNVTSEMGDKINYLGMILERVPGEFTISMKAYIRDVLKEYRKEMKKCISPMKINLFEIKENGDAIKEKGEFHMIVTKLKELMGEELMEKSPVVYQDNTSTISLVTKGGGNLRTKYMKVCQEMIKEKADKGDVKIAYIKMSRMIADILNN